MNPFTKAALAASSVLILTSVHHLYGAWRFDTPWRAHVALIAAIAAIVLGAFLLASRRYRGRPVGRWSLTAFVVLTSLICVAWLGLYEGGYNHAVKDLMFWAGLPAERLLPPGTYEPPTDFFFEASGILQVPAGLIAGRSALVLYRTWHGRGDEERSRF